MSIEKISAVDNIYSIYSDCSGSDSLPRDDIIFKIMEQTPNIEDFINLYVSWYRQSFNYNCYDQIYDNYCFVNDFSLELFDTCMSFLQGSDLEKREIYDKISNYFVQDVIEYLKLCVDSSYSDDE